MNGCSDCKVFYTENFNSFTNYCRETDMYVSPLQCDCPCKKKLRSIDRLKILLSEICQKLGMNSLD
ncbi:MAG: hypothetical protein J5527_09790 [Treponema sp.]|nr:hypothetical protein [Treponema sp.]